MSGLKNGHGKRIEPHQADLTGQTGQEPNQQREAEILPRMRQEATRRVPKPSNGASNEEALLRVESAEERARLLRNLCKITGAKGESVAERIIAQMASMQVW